MQHLIKTPTFSDALDMLKKRVARRGINYSLERLNHALTAMGSPHINLPPTIHVAGTNGKGSVAHYLTQALVKQKKSVITYTSPHIQCYTERFLFNGAPISKDLFAQLIEKVTLADPHHTLSEYELLTLMAFSFAQQLTPDILILETGLGGRLDATNVIPTSMAIITDIGLDHTQILGPTLSHIANEKAGIIKPNAQVITHMDHDPSVLEIIKTHAKTNSATLHWTTPKPNFHNRNKALAAIALNHILDIDDGDTLLSNTPPPFGRLSPSAYHGRACFMDVGHNLNAAKAIQSMLPAASEWIIGMNREKDSLDVLQFLIEQSQVVRLCEFDSAICTQHQDLPMPIRQQVDLWEFNDEILENALFFGSFYFIEKLLHEAPK